MMDAALLDDDENGKPNLGIGAPATPADSGWWRRGQDPRSTLIVTMFGSSCCRTSPFEAPIIGMKLCSTSKLVAAFS